MTDPVCQYRISVTANPKWRDCRRMQIGISMGQRAFEGNKLYSLLSWAASRSDLVILNISDTLHRHNLREECHDSHEAYFCALTMGNQWYERNRDIIKLFHGNNFIMHRWDDWLKHDHYRDVALLLRQHYNKTPAFQEAMTQDREAFFARHPLPEDKREKQRVFDYCTDYLLEELAAYTLIGRAYSANRVYPSADLHSFEYMREADLPEALRGLEQTTHVNVNFKNKKSMTDNTKNNAA